MFSNAFISTPSAEIAGHLVEDGFFACEGAVSPAAIDRMVEEFGPPEVRVNHNGLSPVGLGRQVFLNQVLAQSQTAFDLITSERMLSVGRAALGPKFRLGTKRFYVTHEGHNMPWHRDNKDNPERQIQNLQGLIFILYLTDVTDGAFQIIRGSHRFDRDAQSAYFSESDVEKYQDRVVTFRMPKGGLVIQNICAIHRAAPFQRHDGYSRASLFFGMLAEPTLAEPILINTSFIDPSISDEKRYFLGFGKRELAPVFPETSVETMDDRETIKVARQISSYRTRLGF